MSSVSYEATAGQTDFQITFDYISTAHIQVLIDGIEELDFTITSESLVVLGVGVTVLDGTLVTLQRVTPTSTLLTSFASPSSVRSGEIRTGFRQLLFIAQEILARSLVGIRKTINGQEWDAEGLKMSSLATPTAGDHAATKAYVDTLAAQDGVLPEPLVGDLGKGIRIRSSGGSPSYVIDAVTGATTTFKIPATLVNAGGATVSKEGTGPTGPWASSLTTRMPLALESTAGTPTYGAFGIDANTFDILVPRGTFVIEADGPIRSLTQTTDVNFTSASAALTTSAGTILDVRPLVTLGLAGGSQTLAAERDPFQAQAYVKLVTTQTFAVPTRVNLRISGSTFGDAVIADIPWRVKLTEVVL